MSRIVALAGALAGISFVVFAPAAPAAAAYAPRLTVVPASGGAGSAETTITVAAGQADAATARIVLVVPAGYRVGTAALGEIVGTASGTAVAANGAVVTLGGRVIGAAPGDTGGSCSSGSARWILQLARGTTLLRIPLVVGDAPAAAAGAAAASVTACWPAAAAPESGGLRLLSATFTLSPTSLAGPDAAGAYLWRAQVIPFTAGAATENAAGAVESQAVVAVPGAVVVTAKLALTRSPVAVKVTRTVNGKAITVTERRTLVTRFADISGTVGGAGSATAGTAVDILGGTGSGSLQPLAQAKAGADGSFSARIELDTAAKTVTFQARVAATARDLGAAGCTASLAAAVPCAGATASSRPVASAAVRLATGR